MEDTDATPEGFERFVAENMEIEEHQRRASEHLEKHRFTEFRNCIDYVLLVSKGDMGRMNTRLVGEYAACLLQGIGDPEFERVVAGIEEIRRKTAVERAEKAAAEGRKMRVTDTADTDEEQMFATPEAKKKLEAAQLLQAQNTQRAFKLLTECVARGCSRSKFNYAMMLLRGEACDAQFMRGYRLLNEASADKGLPQGKRDRIEAVKERVDLMARSVHDKPLCRCSTGKECPNPDINYLPFAALCKQTRTEACLDAAFCSMDCLMLHANAEHDGIGCEGCARKLTHEREFMPCPHRTCTGVALCSDGCLQKHKLEIHPESDEGPSGATATTEDTPMRD